MLASAAPRLLRRTHSKIYSAKSVYFASHADEYDTRIRRPRGKNCKHAVVFQYSLCMQSER